MLLHRISAILLCSDNILNMVIAHGKKLWPCRHRWTGRYEAHLWDKSCWNDKQHKKGKQGSFFSLRFNRIPLSTIRIAVSFSLSLISHLTSSIPDYVGCLCMLDRGTIATSSEQCILVSSDPVWVVDDLPELCRVCLFNHLSLTISGNS